MKVKPKKTTNPKLISTKNKKLKVKQKKKQKNDSADRMSGGIWRLAGSEAWDHMD